VVFREVALEVDFEAVRLAVAEEGSPVVEVDLLAAVTKVVDVRYI
jgi:hypothetical protein